MFWYLENQLCLLPFQKPFKLPLATRCRKLCVGTKSRSAGTSVRPDVL